MKNIWLLTMANLRKNKSQAISLLGFVLVAAMLLNIGLVIFFGIGIFFDERAEKNHMAHYTAIYAAGSDSYEKGLQYIGSYPDVTEIETLKSVGGFGDYFINDVKTTCFLFFVNGENSQKMDAPSLVGESLPLAGDAIYIPYLMILSGNYEIGGSFKLNLSGTELEFTIAGATEEIMFGAQMNSVYRFYVSNEKFNEILGKFPENGLNLLSARLENNGGTVFFQAEYNKKISTEGLMWDFIYDNAKQARTMVPSIAAVMVTAFAVILLIVSLIVIHFRINNSIEESMTNIGAQKATGYRSIQIISSIMAQFGSIAAVGAISGIALSLIIIPAITKILEPMTALVWKPGFDIVSAAVSLFSIFLTVIFISFISAQKINRLHPLIALRGGISTHNFKKNAVPLDKVPGPLTLLLALKQLLRSKRQAAAICVIVAAVTMASVAGLAFNYNMNDGKNNFARELFGEMPDVNFMLKDGSTGEEFKERLLEFKETRKVFGYETSMTLLVDETGISATAVEDCSLLEGIMIIDGRYPKHNNEIALGSSIMKVAGKKIGDAVAVKSGKNEKEYIITGMTQFFNSNGFNGIITGGGLSEIQPDFKFTGYNAYLTEGANVKSFIEEVKRAEGDVFAGIMDMKDELGVVMDSMSGIFAAVAFGIASVTVFVVILVLYMVIKTSILRRKRELGIQKAVGFTTFQLMNQIALNMTPVILTGVVIGAAAGYFGLNPMIVALMGQMGIVKVNLPVPLGMTVLVCAALVILAYAVSMLIARRIKKISAYSLISE